MRYSLLAVLFLSMGMLSPAARAQGGWFASPYYFTNAMGDGLLTLDTRNLPVPDPAGVGPGEWFPFRASLWQNGQTISGSGLYPAGGVTGSSSIQPIAFTLQPPGGPAQLYQARLFATSALGGQGTYWNVTTPEQTATWSLSTLPYPINARPQLSGAWSPKEFNEAFGGSYYATANGAAGSAAATWSVTLLGIPERVTQAELSVFLPRQAEAGLLPRTAHAVYTWFSQTIRGSNDVVSSTVNSQPVNQNVTASGWVVVGRFPAGAKMTVTLSAATGETPNTLSVVANAVRIRLVE